MKKDRNCSAPYPIYPAYQGIGPIPYGMPMVGPSMMPQTMTQTQPTYNSYEQQINNLTSQVTSLEKRVSNLENMMNSSNSISNSYNSSNYQML